MTHEDARYLEIHSWRLKDTYILRLHGELDHLGAPALSVALHDALTLQLPVLIVDLTHVSFMASAGAGALINAHQTITARHGRLLVVAPAGSTPRRLLELTRLDTHLSVHEDLEQAMHAIALESPTH
ncbi:STAS domain-containing protein [Planobispora takensis]|uniref:Anti-sigma factor antagonist n=1 Tax=Planobispora takensis TaxID=1367882 RepID=A0A8J3WUV1_9ACTN|nr:STAS domain-containing protein [Planobispora takensis]GII03116.1 anti-sigma factor antagonist [Planobispora takensis]